MSKKKLKKKIAKARKTNDWSYFQTGKGKNVRIIPPGGPVPKGWLS